MVQVSKKEGKGGDDRKRDAILRMLVCAPREKGKEGGKERKRVRLFNECIQILSKLLSIRNLSLEV